MKVLDTLFARSEHFDLEVSVCGYERRSIYVAGASLVEPTQRLVIDYESHGEGAYDDNREWLTRRAAIVEPEARVVERLVNAARSQARVRIDISSMRRSTIAAIIQSLLACEAEQLVQFVYAPAAYEASSLAVMDHVALSAGPISPRFSGGLRPSSIPLGLVAGLGLEPHRALGLTELLEPSQVWAFVAMSDDSRFADAVREVNEPTIDDGQTIVIPYNIRSIAETYAALESLSFAASQSYRLVLAPSGPKMFTLACLLVAAPESPLSPAVWRVGGGPQASAVQVEAAGDVVAADVTFSRRV